MSTHWRTSFVSKNYVRVLLDDKLFDKRVACAANAHKVGALSQAREVEQLRALSVAGDVDDVKRAALHVKQRDGGTAFSTRELDGGML